MYVRHHGYFRGQRLGKGETAEQIAASTKTVAEGVKTAKSAWQLARQKKVDVPITREVHAILYEGKSPKQAVRDLMTREAKPASPHGGQEWVYQQIQDGDQTCKANQALHGEAANLLQKIRANNHYNPKVADPLSPITFVHKIHVPVFMACQWTDEQTGGHCPTLAEHMTGTSRKWFTFTNGTHVDSLDPTTFNRWYDFLQLYVAHQAPITKSAAIHAASPVIYQEAMGIAGVTMPSDPVQQQPTYAGALQKFESFPPIRVLFDNGAGGSEPGQPQPGFENSFSKFPIPGTEGRSWYLSNQGGLSDQPKNKTGTCRSHKTGM